LISLNLLGLIKLTKPRKLDSLNFVYFILIRIGGRNNMMNACSAYIIKLLYKRLWSL